MRALGHYIAIFSVPNHLELDREEVTYVGPGRTALAYSTAGEGGAKAMFLFASEPLNYHPHDRAGQQRLLAEAYAHEGWEVPQLLKHMDDAPDFYFDLIAQVHMEGGWSAGRVVLVGDGRPTRSLCRTIETCPRSSPTAPMPSSVTSTSGLLPARVIRTCA
jgi:hypothetical protein